MLSYRTDDVECCFGHYAFVVDYERDHGWVTEKTGPTGGVGFTSHVDKLILARLSFLGASMPQADARYEFSTIS